MKVFDLHVVENVVERHAMAFHADGVDAGIGADAAGHLRQRFAHLHFLEVDDFGAELLGELQTARMVIDGDDALRAQQECTLDREQPDRPATPHGDDVARLDVAVHGGHPARGQDVREEQHLVVVDAVGDDDRARHRR